MREEITKIRNSALKQATLTIERLVSGSNRNLFMVAKIMKDVNDQELYRRDGYKSVTEYAYEVFSYKPSTTTKMIRVAARFLNEAGTESILPHQQGEDYKMGHLTELLAYDDEVINHATFNGIIWPGMTQADIRKTLKRMASGIEEKEPEEQNKNDERPEEPEPMEEIRGLDTASVASEFDGMTMSQMSAKLASNLDNYSATFVQDSLFYISEFLKAKGF